MPDSNAAIDDIELGDHIQRRQHLEEARRLGHEMEDIAKGTKFNLQLQSDKLEHQTMNKLYGVQTDLTHSANTIKQIEKHQQRNSRLICATKLLVALFLAAFLISKFF